MRRVYTAAIATLALLGSGVPLTACDSAEKPATETKDAKDADKKDATAAKPPKVTIDFRSDVGRVICDSLNSFKIPFTMGQKPRRIPKSMASVVFFPIGFEGILSPMRTFGKRAVF